MTTEVDPIAHLDFALLCESPIHPQRYQYDLPADYALQETHECLKWRDAVFCCYSCTAQVRSRGLMTCPVCEKSYNGSNLKVTAIRKKLN